MLRLSSRELFFINSFSKTGITFKSLVRPYSYSKKSVI